VQYMHVMHRRLETYTHTYEWINDAGRPSSSTRWRARRCATLAARRAAWCSCRTTSRTRCSSPGPGPGLRMARPRGRAGRGARRQGASSPTSTPTPSCARPTAAWPATNDSARRHDTKFIKGGDILTLR
jgi:hypothetical protein